MRALWKKILVFAAAIALVTAFARPDPSTVQQDTQTKAAFESQIRHGHVATAVELLGAATVTKATILVHALPPFDAVLAAATLIIPFGFSTYRTLRRRNSI